MKKILTLALALIASLSTWANITWTSPQSDASVDYYMTMDDGESLMAFKNKTGSNTTPEQKTDDVWAVKTANSGGFWIVPADDVTKLTIAYLCGSTSNTNIQCKVQSADFGTDLSGASSQPFAVKSSEEKNVWFTVEFEIDIAKGQHLYFKFPTNVYISEVVLTTAPKCTQPTNPLVLKASKTADIVVGDEITFTAEGGNEADVAISGKNGETVAEGKWTAVKGEHTFIATQDVKDGVCGNTVELKLTVISNDPVTKAEISGKTSAVVGEEVTLTCTAAEATTFQWYKNGTKIDGATAAEYTFTADAKGALVFACEASNKNNTEPVKSADFTVNVTELCGMLIKAVHKNKNTADIDPESKVGGTADKNTQDNGKLGSNGHYFGVKLATGKFLEGDEVVIVASKLEGGNTATIYADKGEKFLGSADFDENKIASFELTADADAIYVYRTSSACNPTIESITVNRPCDDGTAVLKVNPETIELEATAKNAGKAEAAVTFSGKHLTAGTYNLALTEVKGLSVSPKSVTVDADGKLNAQVTVTFASEEDVESSSAELGLTIGELTKKVAITCSASMKKVFAKSVEIDTLVSNYGKNFAILEEMAKLGYDCSGSGMTLDSLDSSKPSDNEPYLGLKIKKADASIGFWMKPEVTVSIKFGKVSADVKFIANGAEQTKTPTDLESPFEYTAGAQDTYLEFRTTSGDAVVVKKIMFEGGAPLNNDATLKSLKIDDKEVKAENNIYAYEVPVEFAETELMVEFELNDPNAYADKKSPFLAAVPAAGADPIDTKLTVTAEDGTTKVEYTIRISHATAPKNTDATIKELKINDQQIAEKDGVFAYEVEFDSKLAEVEVSFVLNDPKATADRENPFKVAVPTSPEMGATQAVIKVTAEDGIVTKDYKVTITRAEEKKEGVENVADGAKAGKIIENGQLVIIKNGIRYNAQGAALR